MHHTVSHGSPDGEESICCSPPRAFNGWDVYVWAHQTTLNIMILTCLE